MRRSTYVDDIGDLPSRIVLVSLQYPIQGLSLSQRFALVFLFFSFFSFRSNDEKSVVKNSASAVATPCNGPGFVQTSQELERKVCSGGDRI